MPQTNTTVSITKDHHKMVKLILAVLLPLAFCLPIKSIHAQQHSVKVIDGDTIKVGNDTHRLHGIDAPEAGQKCQLAASKKQWKCGKAAIAYLEELILDTVPICDNRGNDGYGRIISVCTASGEDINAEMVRAGYAWSFRKFSVDYAEEEDRARQMKLGVFQTDTQTPWEYRSEKWSVGVQVSPEGCPIKGNISKNGRIYHAPWSPYYSRTKISTEKGERWFCNEAEAIEAGWRAPYWGR